ncbi:FMN-dependent oxidoreductase (nitrilotriacetate monooxygenase family) [Paraburkholderia caballeronis]|uniref:NtaA/DmoA family FMN-dependent monooxygenase n=1 Tax=Paraburkholderia caballeronis TaxID=416943 RepID=UPI0010664CDF|nr:NtaA/DmoA family FMN-dependent monooxygenase [Paraburkholderia caballeronis]TDV39398.1 FMN-dependent oxidoreductase (nitrilotriacetate monooxygenase family) [Paraburkholderia caballeronis]
MARTPFHLAWFISRGYGPKAWRLPWGGPNPKGWTSPDLFVDLSRALERAAFDYVMIEDSSNIPYTYQNSHDTYLRYAVDSPKLDPAVLASFLIQATQRLGVVTTLSTTEYHPFQLARLTNTLDHVSRGRAGWNLVTGSNDGGAQNFGLDRQYPHDQRYDMADEYVDLVIKLWESWDADAVVMDQQNEIFADPSKVRPVHFEGQYFRSRGPLGAPRSPQGRPVICQAGGSTRGRQFAARWAETVIGTARSVASMKAFRDDIRAKAREAGRDPDTVKVLFLITPIVDESRENAEMRRRAQLADAEKHIEAHLASLSRTSGIDFSQFDLDEPLPELKSNGHQTLVAQYTGRTLREISGSGKMLSDVNLVGTAQDVAARLSEIVDEVGGDGFLLMDPDLTRRYIAEITDGLVPELQRLGVVRTQYEHERFRDNLLAF